MGNNSEHKRINDNNAKKTESVDELNAKILAQIAELIPQAPEFWMDAIAGRMDKKRTSIFYYAKGERGMRKGYHEEVLLHLTDLVEKEKERKNSVIQESAKMKNKPSATCKLLITDSKKKSAV